MTGRLEGKTAVVTGGCSGIGLATVRRFGEEGAKVVIGDLDDSRGPGVADEVGGTYVHANVTDKEQVDALFATAQSTYGSVDVAFTGSAPDGRGFWFPPTVVLADSVEQRIWREEVFGPVVAVMPFRDEAEAVQLANDSEFGLSGSIYTGDVGRALRVSRGVEAGNLSVNTHSSVRYWTPFGGFKQSGLGRELGPDAPHSFTDVKNVFISDESPDRRNP